MASAHHIGYDRILFLIACCCAVLVRRAAVAARCALAQAVWPIVSTVTMFTLGHSITLALAG